MIPSLVNLVYNYRSFSKVIIISRNTFFNITYLYSKGDITTLHPPLAIWAYIRLASINYYILIKFLILFNNTLIKLRYFLTFLIRFYLGFNKKM